MSRTSALALFASFLAGLSLGACGPTRSLCARVTCDGDRICDEATGACVAACVPACDGGTHCDKASGQCVQCLTDEHCACPTPVCSAQTCVAPDAVPVPDAGASCADAPTLRLCDAPRTLTVDLAAQKDTGSPSCGPSDGGADGFFGVRLDSAADLQVSAQASGSTQPTVALFQGCQAELDCATAPAASFTARDLAAGTYTLWVDTAGGTGPVQVTLTPRAASNLNDTCAQAKALVLDGGPSAPVDLSLARDDVTLSCNQGGPSPDVFYTLTLAAQTDVQLTARSVADAGTDVVLGLLDSPCPTGAERACADNTFSGQAETITARRLPAGTYVVVVESYGAASAGPATVEAIALPPEAAPANDTCAAPAPLVLDGGTTSFTVDTSTATDDYTGSCNASTRGPEVVYSLTLAAPGTLTATSTAAAGSATDAVLYLRGGDCDAGTELACNDGYPSDTITAGLDAGTYYLFVEGFGSAGAGPTDVTVSVAP